MKRKGNAEGGNAAAKKGGCKKEKRGGETRAEMRKGEKHGDKTTAGGN